MTVEWTESCVFAETEEEKEGGELREQGRVIWLSFWNFTYEIHELLYRYINKTFKTRMWDIGKSGVDMNKRTRTETELS